MMPRFDGLAAIARAARRLFTRMEPPMQFVQAKHFTPATRTKVDLIVIHTMEAHERPETAENVGSWFAGPQAPRASAHYCVDANSVVCCVHEKDVAWHANQVNGTSIGIEHAGFAKQTPEEWADDYSLEMLGRSARLAAEVCARWQIPVRRLTPDELKAGERGFVGHVDVNAAYAGGKGHWDPGPAYPWDWYLDQVRMALDDLDLPPTNPEGSVPPETA